MTASSSALDGLQQVNTVATHAANTVLGLGSDFLIVIILLALLFAFAWYVGRGQFVSLLLSFYAAYAVYVVFPYESLVPTSAGLSTVAANIVTYLILVLGFYWILKRVVVSDFLYIGIFGLLLLSFVGAAFLLALAFHIFAVPTVYHFTAAVTALFEPHGYFFWWFIAPAVGLFIFAR